MPSSSRTAHCHVKFNKAAQDSLCLDCHKETAKDVRAKAGYHGRIQIDACRSCHTDHKGRDVNIAAFDAKTFDHAKTDFALAGAHVQGGMPDVPRRGKEVPRGAPAGCNDCHRKDDKHKGSLGASCADCHSQADWKDARFDHAKTRFALTGKHVDTRLQGLPRDDAYQARR